MARTEAPAATFTPPAEPNGNGEVKRGRKPGSTNSRPDTSSLDLTAIATVSVATPEIASATAPRQERTAQQQAMDKVVQRAHDEWVKADRPNAWPHMPVITYYLEPGEVEGYKYLIRRGADLYGFAAKFGTPVRLSEEMARKAHRNSADVGKEVLTFAVRDKRPRSTDK